MLRSEKYKIVLFNDSLLGGAGSSILTLAEALRKNKVEVHIVICENRIDFDIPNGVSLHILDLQAGRTYSKKALSEKLREKLYALGDVDIVMSNSSPSNKILSRLKIPNIYHCVRSAETKSFYGIFKSLRAAWRNRKYRKLYTGKNIITVSKGLEKVIIKQIGAKPQSIQTIYEPFDFLKIAKLSEEKNTKIPKEEYLIHVGRFDLTHKRQDILLKAYKKANVRYRLVLLGDGEDKEKIQSYIEKLELENSVLLPGFSDNPFPWIRQAKLFVFSSDFEGFGRVLVEALTLNTPVVSTDCPSGPNEILTGELSEYLVKIGDSDALASAITKALDHYPKITKETLMKFEDDIIAKQYIELMNIFRKYRKSMEK